MERAFPWWDSPDLERSVNSAMIKGGVESLVYFVTACGYETSHSEGYVRLLLWK